MPKYRFVSLERRTFFEELFPDGVEIGETLDGSRGGTAVTLPLGMPEGFSRKVVIKVSSVDAEDVESDEVLLRRSLPLSWRGIHQEYVKLTELNGLGGRAPRAYAYGAVVWEDGTTEKALPAYVMEDMRGKPSRPLVDVMDKRREGFSAAATAEFGARLLEIIWRQRGCGITHADLSPRNVFVRVVGQGAGARFEDVYVIDYGQAKFASSGVTPAPGGRFNNQRLATVEYGAPEIFPFKWEGRTDLGVKPEELQRCYGLRNNFTVDVWSLGALLLYVRTGNPPTPGVIWDGQGFQKNGKRVEPDGAHRAIVLEKRKGLALPRDAYSTEEDRRLNEVIRICTDPDPVVRSESLQGVKEKLNELRPQDASGGGTVSMDVPTAGPARTPVPAAPGDVVAVTCKLYREGRAYSLSPVDLVLFTQGSLSSSERVKIDGKEYDLRQVDEHVMSDRGWHVWQGISDCPWQGVEFALFRDKVSPKSLVGWFAGCSRLRRVMRINNLDTSKATSMRGMFYDCSSLRALSVYGFDTSLVEDMSQMFYGCRQLQDLNISRFETARLENARDMFAGCTSLRSIEGFPWVFSDNPKIDLKSLGRDCPALSER